MAKIYKWPLNPKPRPITSTPEGEKMAKQALKNWVWEQAMQYQHVLFQDLAQLGVDVYNPKIEQDIFVMTDHFQSILYRQLGLPHYLHLEDMTATRFLDQLLLGPTSEEMTADGGFDYDKELDKLLQEVKKLEGQSGEAVKKALKKPRKPTTKKPPKKPK